MFKPLIGAAATSAAAVLLAACSPSSLEISPSAEAITADTANPPTLAEAEAENSDNTVTKDDEWSMDDAQDFTGSEITASGVYRVSGQAGDITVNAPTDSQVVLVLDDAAVGAITAQAADDVAVYLEGSSTSGAIQSEADLTISGEGSLQVTAAEDAIVSKDDLTVLSGILDVTAGDDGLRGTDSVTVEGGTISVDAGGDAITSTKDDDRAKGWIRIAGGTVHLTAGDDALSAYTDVLVEGATIEANAKDKGINSGTYLLSSGGKVSVDAADDALHSDGGLRLSGGEFTLAAGDDGIHAEVATVLDGANVTISESTEGIEGGLITIAAGNINVTSTDDGVNASGSTTAEAGAEAIASAAAETETSEDDATASEENSSESVAAPGDPERALGELPEGGFPQDGERPEPAGGGTMSAEGGPQSQGMNGGMGESTGEQLNVTGGTVTVNASGDGLDSNGDFTMSGGVVTVWGPTNDGNSAVDAAGDFTVNGGELLAVGSAGMAESPSTTNSQGWISAGASGNEGDTLSIKDASGGDVASFSATKTFANVLYSSADISNGQAYTVTVTSTDSTDADSETAVTAGEAATGGMGAGMGRGMNGNASLPAA